jgi:hypothetical protein
VWGSLPRGVGGPPFSVKTRPLCCARIGVQPGPFLTFLSLKHNMFPYYRAPRKNQSTSLRWGRQCRPHLSRCLSLSCHCHHHSVAPSPLSYPSPSPQVALLQQTK